MPPLDDSVAALTKGYGWLPDRRRAAGRATVTTRIAGKRVLALMGPEAARFFYDENHVRRHGAVPLPVAAVLFGRGGVQTLDGEAHRVRKGMHVALLEGGGEQRLVDCARRAWDDAARSWPARERIVLFDEAAQVLTEAVYEWARVPHAARHDRHLAADLVPLVGGFADPAGYLRAVMARAQREARLVRLVHAVRRGEVPAPPGSALAAVVTHRDADGALLSARVAAVELLNALRPTVVVCWYVAFAGHALIRWPEHRARLAEDPAFAEAFAQEVRRFYPFVPFVGGKAVRDLEWDGERVPAGSMVVLDLYGQDHDERLWRDPYTFRPERFLGREADPFTLVPQGGGEPRVTHGCSGDAAAVALLRALLPRLARLRWTAPEQDLSIPLSRTPTRPRSGVVLQVHGEG